MNYYLDRITGVVAGLAILALFPVTVLFLYITLPAQKEMTDEHSR